MHAPEKVLHDLVERELRAAVAARIQGGTDPGEVTIDLARRLRRIGEMRSGARASPGPDP